MEFEKQTLDYILPEDKIAAYPLPIRHNAKLLVYKNKQISHHQFHQLNHHIDENSLLVFNNTKVFHARLHFVTETGKTIEVFCLTPANDIDPAIALASFQQCEWICMIGGAKKWKTGKIKTTIQLHDDLIIVEAELIARQNDSFHISFHWNNAAISFAEILQTAGELPLPPYMNRKANSDDEVRYQTVYAKQSGSVAAPTAGLHFTDEVLNSLSLKHIASTFVTLHVGAGTFKPIKTDHYNLHEMHEELIDVDIKSVEDLIQYAGKIIAVGTTSLRTIESLYWMGVKAHLNENIAPSNLHLQQWEAYDLAQNIDLKAALLSLVSCMKKNKLHRLLSKTKIMITPEYRLRVAEGLITNFHQPKSTLLLIIASIVGQHWEKIYQEALQNNYRFLSYGDSSLLIKN